MRKIYLVVVSLIMAFATLFCGCSCNGDLILEFTNAFTGGDNSLVGETLVYKVQNKDKYGTEFNKDAQITKDIVDYAYNGTYTLTWEQIGQLPEKTEFLENSISSNIVNPKESTHYYKLTSKLELTTSYYSVNGKKPEPTELAQDPTAIKEYIYTDTYFCVRGKSYAPIYSETDAFYSNISYFEAGKNYEAFAAIEFTTNKAYTEYNENSYKMSVRINKAPDYTTTIYDYSFRTVIDNAQLIFLLRNINFAQNSTITLPTVSYTYGKAKELTVIDRGANQAYYDNPLHPDNGEDGFFLKVNGAPMLNQSETGVQYKIPTKKIGFYVNDRMAAGTEQTLLIQTEAYGDLAMRALPLEYVQPICTNRTFKSLGVMQFNLIEVITTNS